MRKILLFWFCPIAFLASWYGLAVNDLSLGMHFYSRAQYDQIMDIYGLVLGVAPETVPGLVARALALDSLIVLGFLLLRKRRAILAFVRQKGPRRDQASSMPGRDESLSSAP